MMQTDDGRVEIEVCMNSGWIALTLRKAKFFREKHEYTRKIVVKFTVAFPEPAVHHILWVVVWLWSVDVLQD